MGFQLSPTEHLQNGVSGRSMANKVFYMSDFCRWGDTSSGAAKSGTRCQATPKRAYLARHGLTFTPGGV